MTIKATGIVRRIDHLGRICLPKELRNVLGIAKGDSVEILSDDDAIVLKKVTGGFSLQNVLSTISGQVETSSMSESDKDAVVRDINALMRKYKNIEE